MRATLISSKGGSATHNDRSFDLDKALHIDQEQTKNNRVRAKNVDKYRNLEEAEIARYAEIYADHIQRKKAEYHMKRQYQREEEYTAEKLYKGRLTKPTETIYQIGSLTDGTVTPELLTKCFVDFIRKCRKNIPHFCDCVQILSYSLHTDEATAHIHERHAFWANGEPSQKKALAIMGFERPDASKPEGQYNNALMTFTAKCRELWIETILEHGIEVERTPVQTHKRKHLTPAQFYYQQEAEVAKRLSDAKEEQEQAEKMVNKAKELVEKSLRYHQEAKSRDGRERGERER